MTLTLNYVGGGNSARDAIPIRPLRQVSLTLTPPASVKTAPDTVTVPCFVAQADDKAALLGSASIPAGLIVGAPWVSAPGELTFPLMSNSGTLTKLTPFAVEILLMGKPT